MSYSVCMLFERLWAMFDADWTQGQIQEMPASAADEPISIVKKTCQVRCCNQHMPKSMNSKHAAAEQYSNRAHSMQRMACLQFTSAGQRLEHVGLRFPPPSDCQTVTLKTLCQAMV